MRAVALVRRAADLALVRAAVALGDCTAISLAPDADARPILVAARAAGATRAIQLWDPALEGNDFLAVAHALAAAVRSAAGESLSSTLVLAGDRGRGAVGPALAERLQWPLLGQVLGLEHDGKRVTARRRFRSVIKLYAAELPAVVSLLVDEELAKADAPEAKPDAKIDAKADAKIDAKADAKVDPKIDAWTLASVGLSAAELTYRKRFLPHPSPGPERVARRLPDARALAERLRAEGLLSPPGSR